MRSLRELLEAATLGLSTPNETVQRRAAAFDEEGRRYERPLLTMYTTAGGAHSLVLCVGVPLRDGPVDWADGFDDPFVALEFGAHGRSTASEAVLDVLDQVRARATVPDQEHESDDKSDDESDVEDDRSDVEAVLHADSFLFF
jgi:hypothetical protein